MQRLCAEGFACATVDLSDIGNQLSLDRWYAGVAYKLVSSFRLFDTSEFMNWWRDRILRNEQRAGRLLGLYQQILQHGEVATNHNPEQAELRLLWLVVKQQIGRQMPVLNVYNRIDQEVFNERWVEEELGKLRPYAEAIATWLASNCQDDSRLLGGQALREALDWGTGKSLSDQDYQLVILKPARNLKYAKTHLIPSGRIARERSIPVALTSS